MRFAHREYGLPAVCNLALREARGEYVMRLDGDDVLDENALLVLVNYLDREPDLALVFPDYYLMDEGGEILAHERRQKLAESNHRMEPPPNGACTLIRRSVLESIGGYREDLGAQDGFDLWAKVRDTASGGQCEFAAVLLPPSRTQSHE